MAGRQQRRLGTGPNSKPSHSHRKRPVPGVAVLRHEGYAGSNAYVHNEKVAAERIRHAMRGEVPLKKCSSGRKKRCNAGAWKVLQVKPCQLGRKANARRPSHSDVVCERRVKRVRRAPTEGVWCGVRGGKAKNHGWEQVLLCSRPVTPKPPAVGIHKGTRETSSQTERWHRRRALQRRRKRSVASRVLVPSAIRYSMRPSMSGRHVGCRNAPVSEAMPTLRTAQNVGR